MLRGTLKTFKQLLSYMDDSQPIEYQYSLIDLSNMILLVQVITHQLSIRFSSLQQLLNNYFNDFMKKYCFFTNTILALIITIIIKCAYELFLKYTYASITKLDIMKVIVTAFEIALIGILSNSSTSLSSIQALFIIVVVIDLLYVLGTTILKAMDKKKKQEEGPGEIHESNKDIVNPTINPQYITSIEQFIKNQTS